MITIKSTSKHQTTRIQYERYRAVFFYFFFPFSGIGFWFMFKIVQVYFGCYLALWIQGSAARNARKGYNLGGKSYLLRRYVRIHRVGSWKTLFLPFGEVCGFLVDSTSTYCGHCDEVMKERLSVWTDIYV